MEQLRGANLNKSEKWYRVGRVDKFSERYFAAACLAASYERENWRWGLSAAHHRVPSALDVQRCIDELRGCIRGGVVSASVESGGLRLVREDDGFVLYCEMSLKPTVTMQEVQELEERRISDKTTV